MLHRRGAALAVTLFLMAVAAALIVTGSFLVRRQVAAASVDRGAIALEPLAERGLLQAIAAWDSSARRADVPGVRTDLPGLVEAQVVVAVRSTRLTAATWWITSEAQTEHKPLLRRRLGVLIDARSGRAIPAAPFSWFELP